jgi:phage regulator Rha-like protein
MANAIMPQSNPYANAINNALATLTSPVASMTSKEIADMVGSRHDKVTQSIERLAKRGTIQLPPMGEVENKQSLSPNNKVSVYIFSGEQGKRDSYVVVAQLSPEFTARLVDRWQELERQVSGETQQPTPLPTPEQQAVVSMQAWSQLGDIFACPKHIALQEGVKAVQTRYGVDLAPLLKASPYTDNIPSEDVMLEPTDLGERLGFGKGKPAGEAINKLLEALGWQIKVGKVWEPTDMGAPHCAKHSWRTEFKSGYNYKWRLKDVEALLSVPSK